LTTLNLTANKPRIHSPNKLKKKEKRYWTVANILLEQTKKTH